MGRKLGRPPTFTDEEIEKALRAATGIQSVAAQHLGCHPNTVAYHLRHSPKLRKTLDEIHEEDLDFAEGKLKENIHAGKERSIFFLLERKGKHRGWGRDAAGAGAAEGAPRPSEADREILARELDRIARHNGTGRVRRKTDGRSRA